LDRLVRYRNWEVGHGAAGQRPADFYDRPGQPVVICCEGCKKQAEVDPDNALAKVKNVKAKAATEAKKDDKKDGKN
jgi:hypothetical protein